MNYHLLLGHRKSPVLTTTNALIASAIGALTKQATTINHALRMRISEVGLRKIAVDNTLETLSRVIWCYTSSHPIFGNWMVMCK